MHCFKSAIFLKSYLTVFWFTFLLELSEGQRRFSSNAYTFNCAGDLQSESFVPSSPGDNGYRLSIVGQPQSYQPLQQYTVSLKSKFPVSFRGFAIRTTDDDGNPVGTFTPIISHLPQERVLCPNVITHASEGKKVRVQVHWTAPESGCVRLSASVVKKGTSWFKDSGHLSLRICSENTTLPSGGSSNGECCACGEARYLMTFYGLWSPTSHPKDYPAFSTHWSNIIGASHSSNYVIWEYGGFASEGVQKVAEWGWVNNLEEEIRAQDESDVLSVIKTKAQWPAYQPRNLRAPPSDEFHVDSGRHFVSLLTMLGPSPDWNVGLTRQSMCTETCGWVGTRTFDVIPWDAGTDSGVTYMAANSPTTPHERIRNLTSSDDPRSPFYDIRGGPIPPVARIVIRRRGLSGTQCGTSEEILDDINVIPMSFDQSSHENSSLCLYSQWSDWSECGVTCGWGIKTRNRMVKFNPDQRLCEFTMEKEICQGNGRCGNQSDVTTCLYSEWATWTPCSSACGGSSRIRSRALQWPSEPQNCQEPLKDMSFCPGPTCACSYSQWSDWMSCPVTCGIGQTVRKRQLLSLSSDCQARVMETSPCMTSMTCESDATEAPGCAYLPWSDWSPCPVTCGVGQSVRKKFLRSNSSSCEDFVMETSKCMTSSSCSEECEYGEWSEWMPCSTTCGVGETIRKRFLAESLSVDPNTQSNCNAFVMEQAPCHNGPCDQTSSSSCEYQPWSRWMPCSVTCGKGETLRKRFLNSSASAEGCLGFEMENNICMVACTAEAATSQCVYSDWTTWMPCDVSCKTFRKKLLQNASSSSCEAVVKERKRCPNTQCRRGRICRTSVWQPWSACSVTCGSGGYVTRSRQISQSRPISCTSPILTQRRKCRAPRKCGFSCQYTSWSNWSTCRCSERTQSFNIFRIRQKIPTRRDRNTHRCKPKIQRRRCRC